MGSLLELEGVCKTYARGERRLRVLANLSLEIHVGEVAAVVGSRGEGKTTLLQIAAGIQRPDRGAVMFDGVEMLAMSDRRRSELLGGTISWVTREDPGLRLQVRDGVAMPLAIGRRRRPREVVEAADDALERVGAADCARRLWEELSNWERVLVCFARVIVARPRLVVLDDLFEGLAAPRMREAGAWLRTLTDELGCAVLMSASDVEGVLAADRVWSLVAGGLEPMTAEPVDAEVIEFPHGAKRRPDACDGFAG
jgi:ABC-type lipoprotein export system ATPase subunit